MTAIAMQPSASYAADRGGLKGASDRAPLHLMGATLPPALRTVGALAALLLAIAVTGVVLVGFALVMPFALIASLIARRWQPRSERAGWRPATA